MTPDESRRLELARRIWHEAQPSDDEIERALRRMQTREVRPRSRSFRPRVGPALAVAVALVAVLAYAAPGSRVRIVDLSQKVFGSGAAGGALAPVPSARPSGAGASRAPEPATRPPPSVVARPSAPEEPALRAPSAERAATDSARERERAASAPPAAKPRGATWQDVNRALADGDDAAAARALRELEHGARDLGTRAKARLGLAQLAVGRGDCSAARRLARSVATMPNLDEKLVHRAHSVLLRCELR